jgi:putative ABC transport system ATP-binding protein
MGPSGSGKTSLLYTLAGIELPQQGTVRWGNVEVNHLSSIGRDRWRQKNVGFVFQDIHLIPGLTALQNVLLPVSFQARNPSSEIKQRGRELLNRVGLDPGRTPVEKLSRGEMQRVAVARALIMKPPILLADEPTGSLDAATALKVAGILLRLCGEGETTLIMVSHDPAVMNLFPSRFLLKNSRLMKG